MFAVVFCLLCNCNADLMQFLTYKILVLDWLQGSNPKHWVQMVTEINANWQFALPSLALSFKYESKLAAMRLYNEMSVAIATKKFCCLEC